MGDSTTGKLGLHSTFRMQSGEFSYDFSISITISSPSFDYRHLCLSLRIPISLLSRPCRFRTDALIMTTDTMTLMKSLILVSRVVL